MSSKEKVLIFIVAYNAGPRLVSVLKRIPGSIFTDYDVSILIIDDFSNDDTFEYGMSANIDLGLPVDIRVLQNQQNQGYGGNQKLGYHYALEYGFDYVVLLHGDGQYAPEVMPELLEKIIRENADAIFGSRILSGVAMKEGMPAYKYIGNRILTFLQNRILGTRLSEFHSGYRVYKVSSLAATNFELNTNDFHFDTQIIIQLVKADAKIIESAIPTYYGDEICHVDGLKYALDVMLTTIRAKAQDYHILYDRKYDGELEDNQHYIAKSDFPSPHQFVVNRLRQQSEPAVLDIGCAGGYVSEDLAANGARVTGVDLYPVDNQDCFVKFVQCDLDQGLPADIRSDYDYILLLDIVEHLKQPERFMTELKTVTAPGSKPELIISTGNVAFIIIRLMLLFGQFNYGKKGILDLTHTRLFTFRSLRAMLEQCGYTVKSVQGIPMPFPLLVNSRSLSSALVKINKFFIKISKTLFSYQMIMVAQPNSSLEEILRQSEQHTRQKLIDMNAGVGDK